MTIKRLKRRLTNEVTKNCRKEREQRGQIEIINLHNDLKFNFVLHSVAKQSVKPERGAQTSGLDKVEQKANVETLTTTNTNEKKNTNSKN